MAVSAQWVRVYRMEPPYSVEVVHAHYVQHRFARHAHEHFVVGLVEKGVQQYTYRGAKHTTPAGQIFFVNGDEPHTGEPATSDGYLYRTLCLSPQVFRQLAWDITGRSGLPYLKGAVVVDQKLSAKLGRLHCAVAANAPAMECESFLLEAVRYLFEAHACDRRDVLTIGREIYVVKQIREYLEAHYADDVPLAQLSALTCMSPFHVARAFSKEVGLPPHAYLESIRIRHARELLRVGMTVVDTALAIGYPDQSHFTHRFRRLTGTTPGQYRRSTRQREA
jgi:AraC-like DNA-binding protein